MWFLRLLFVKELVTAQTPAPIEGVPHCVTPIANVVLVHGILGWGPDEVLGLPHIKHGHVLEENGCFNVHTVALAILGSNHDRCAQLHAQLVGGYADHGLEHSTNISVQHDRYGDKNYTAFIPDFLVPGNMRTYFVAHSLVRAFLPSLGPCRILPLQQYTMFILVGEVVVRQDSSYGVGRYEKEFSLANAIRRCALFFCRRLSGGFCR